MDGQHHLSVVYNTVEPATFAWELTQGYDTCHIMDKLILFQNYQHVKQRQYYEQQGKITTFLIRFSRSLI